MHAMSSNPEKNQDASNAARTLTFTARFTPVEDGQVQATIDELPGVITAARSQGEAMPLLVDALETYLLALGDRHRASRHASDDRTEPLRIAVGI